MPKMLFPQSSHSWWGYYEKWPSQCEFPHTQSESPPMTYLHNILIAYIPFITIWYCPWMCTLGFICLSALEMWVAIFVLLTAPLATLFKNFLFIYFNWRLITLQYCTGFCHTLTWISYGCTYGTSWTPLLNSPPELPSYLPPHPIPQGHPSAPALSTLPHALNLDWQSISHMVI